MKKQLLIALITILGFMGVGLNKAYADGPADVIRNMLSALGPCEDVLLHLDTETMRECPGGESCANFQVELTPVEEGDESFCRLEGSSDFGRPWAREEILVGIRLGRPYPDRLISFGGPIEITNVRSSFTYEVHNPDFFARYDHLELRFEGLFGFAIKRINFSTTTINPSFLEELLSGGDDDADGGAGGGGGGGGGGDGGGDGGGGGGGEEDIVCQRIFNCDGSETLCQEAGDGCVAIADVSLCDTTVEITPNCSSDEGPRPPGTETLRGITEADLNNGAGGGTGGGPCALNTKATPSGFGFGLLALLISSLVLLRRFPRSIKR